MWIFDLKEAIDAIEAIADPYALTFERVEFVGTNYIFYGSDGRRYVYDISSREVHVI